MPYIKINWEDIYFDRKVQEMCVSNSFTCPYYDHSWSCPPVAPYMEETISSYKDFYLVYSKFDLETYIQKEKQKNPQRSEKYIKNMYLLKSVRLNLLDSEFERLLEEYEKSYSKKLFLYYGTCNYCEIQNAGSCTYDDGEPCRFPEERRYSMEAVGIEVIKTVRNIDIDIGYPSQKFSFKFGLACFK